MERTDISRETAVRGLPRVFGVPWALLGRKVAFFHTEPGWRQHLKAGKAPFPARLAAMLQARGYLISFLPYRRRPWPRWIWGRTLHIYLGPAQGQVGPGCLILHPAYVNRFWYLDPKGHRENSSVVEQPYDPASIDPAAANARFAETRRATVKGGWSIRAQPKCGTPDLPGDVILIALQKIPQGRLPRGAICSEVEMIRAVVAARGTREVVIKYHPFGVHPDTAAVVDRIVADDPAVRLVEANIHDLLGKAAVLCCFSSGTGFEAMLHRVPTILFATADFHKGAITLEKLGDLPDALAKATERQFNYPKFVHWFQTTQMWHAEQPDLDARLDALLERISGGRW